MIFSGLGIEKSILAPAYQLLIVGIFDMPEYNLSDGIGGNINLLPVGYDFYFLVPAFRELDSDIGILIAIIHNYIRKNFRCSFRVDRAE